MIRSWTTDSTLSVHRGFPRPSRSADGETDVILFAPASALFGTGDAPRGMPDDPAATFVRSPFPGDVRAAGRRGGYLSPSPVADRRQQQAWPPLGPLRD